MWKKVIDMEAQSQAEEDEESALVGNAGEPILSIHEEEEEPGSREEEDEPGDEQEEGTEGEEAESLEDESPVSPETVEDQLQDEENPE